MPLFRRLAVLATAAEAARRYAKSNPDKAGRIVDQAAQFVDKQTKGRYSGQIRGAADSAKRAAGIRPTGHGPDGNGHTRPYDQNAGYGTNQGYTAPPPPHPQPGPQSGQQPGQPSH
jgi:hypothetical protein